MGPSRLWTTFDSHMSLQQESFLKPRQQDISKKHGKMRTMFDRLVIAVHLLNTYCGAFQDAKGQAAFDMEGTWGQDVDPAAQVPLSVVEMTYFLCEHFEHILGLSGFRASRPHIAPRGSRNC